MSYNTASTSKESSIRAQAPGLPHSLAELHACLQTKELALDLLTRITQEPTSNVRWAEKTPLCARELVKILFCEKNLEQVAASFFSNCLNDPELRKAMIKIASPKTSDSQTEKVQQTLKQNIEKLAQSPAVFFELLDESIKTRNRSLAIILINYLGNNLEFAKSHFHTINRLISESLSHDDDVILESIVDSNLTLIPGVDGVRLSTLVIYKSQRCIDLLIQKGLVSSMYVSAYCIEAASDSIEQELIDLLVANGAIVEKRFGDYDHPKVTKAYQGHEQYKVLHSDGLTLEYLQNQKTEALWFWLAFDRKASSVIAKYPDYFKKTLLSFSNEPPHFSLTLKKFQEAKIFDPHCEGAVLMKKAIMMQNGNMIEVLISAGVPLNSINTDVQTTPFEFAMLQILKVPNPNINFLKLIINHPHTDCNARFSDGSHPFEWICSSTISSKHLLVQFLLDKGVRFEEIKVSLLDMISCLKTEDLPLLKILISKGLALSEKNENQDNICHILVRKCKSEPAFQKELLPLIRQILIKEPKTFRAWINKEGKTSLELAIELGLPQIALIFLQTGFSPSAQQLPSSKELSDIELQLILLAFEPLPIPSSISDLSSWMTVNHLLFFFGDAILKKDPSLQMLLTKDNPHDVSFFPKLLKCVKDLIALRGSQAAIIDNKSLQKKMQGNRLHESLAFVAALLSQARRILKDHNTSQEELDIISNVEEKLARACSLTKLLTACILNDDFRRKYLPIISANIEAQIQALCPGESLLLPCGWTGDEGQYHAMLIEVVKNHDQKCSMSVLNTGPQFGADVHAKHPTALKTLINTARSFIDIPQEELCKTAFIPSLLAPQSYFVKNGARNFTAQDIYHLVCSRFNHYLSPHQEDLQGCFSTAQRSGTCFMRVVLAALQLLLGSPLYKKTKLAIDQAAFEAIADPNFRLEPFAYPSFLRLIQHAIERSALNLNKYNTKNNPQLSSVEKFANLLQDVHIIKEEFSNSIEKTDQSFLIQNSNSTSASISSTPFLKQAADALSSVRKKIELTHIETDSPVPEPFASPYCVNFSMLKTKEEWIGAVENLNLFFEKSMNCLLDPLQTVAINVTVQSIRTLALPKQGVFHSAIDSGTPLGDMTTEEKKEFKQKLGTLARKFATALYEQRKAAAEKSWARSGWGYGSDNKEPDTEAESVDPFICINKIYAYCWRLSLSLDHPEGSPLSLRHYGIDVSHLLALYQSLHLPCYRQHEAKELNQVIDFFMKSHPDPGNPNRTILALGLWSENGFEISFPLLNADLIEWGDIHLCKKTYPQVPAETWKNIDSLLEVEMSKESKGWIKPELEEWRLTHLFAHPQDVFSKTSNKTMDSLELYQDLRTIAFTCWLFKTAPHHQSIQFSAIESEPNSKRMKTHLKATPDCKNLEKKIMSAMDPLQVSKWGHRPLASAINTALSGSVSQNEYMIKFPQLSRFFDIAHAKPFCIYRLLSFYKENTHFLKNKTDQTFFQLVLFGSNRLASAKEESPKTLSQLLDLIELALQEFKLQLHAKPFDNELIGAITFLHTLKLRMHEHLAIDVSAKQREALQQEIDSLLNHRCDPDNAVSSLTDSLQLSLTNRAELMLLWIFAQPDSNWALSDKCTQALIYLNKAELLAARLDDNSPYVDPTLQANAYQAIFSHFDQIKIVLNDPDRRFDVIKKILDAYGVAIDNKDAIQGEFPQFALAEKGHLYELNLLSTAVLRDKLLIKDSIPFFYNPTIREFSERRKSPLDTHRIRSNELHTQFYATSEGNEYYFTVIKKEQDPSKWITQIEWIKGSERYCYIPFESLPKEMKTIALAKFPKKENYYFWVNTNPSSQISAIIQDRTTGEDEVVIYNDGSTKRGSSDEKWLYHSADSIPEIQALTQMRLTGQIAVWEKVDESGLKEIVCYGLQDGNRMPLCFKSTNSNGSFDVVNIPGYSVSVESTVKGLSHHFPYLIISNPKGDKKVIVPIKTWSEITNKDPENIEAIYSYEEIPIDKKGYPSSSEIRQNLLIAYLFIGAKQYDRALAALKKAQSHSEVYTPEEIKMLGWIILHNYETKDSSPKAIALSLMAAWMIRENLHHFPDAYPTPNFPSVLSSFYSEPKFWVHFCQGFASYSKTDKNLSMILGDLLIEYYEISSHCKGEFQIHEKYLTAFQEADWLKEITAFATAHSLKHRLHFLLSGKSAPMYEPPAPIVNFMPMIDKDLSRFDWIHSIDVNSSEYGSILSEINRIRPEEDLKNAFGKLFALATQGTSDEKEQLLFFLKDMQYDPDKTNQLIRAILLSQLPPYDSAPASSGFLKSYTASSSNSPQTLSQQIAELIAYFAKNRHREGATLSEYYYDYRAEKDLLLFCNEWIHYFFQSKQETLEKTNSSVDVDAASLISHLPKEKKGKLPISLLSNIEHMITQLEIDAQELFVSRINTPSTTNYPPLPPKMQKDPYFQMRGDALREDLKVGIAQNESKKYFHLDVKNTQTDPLPQLQAILGEKDERIEELEKRKKEIKKTLTLTSSSNSTLSGDHPPPEFSECIILFAKGNPDLFQQRMPFLSESACLDLYNKIGLYLEFAKLTQLQTSLEAKKKPLDVELKKRKKEIKDLVLQVKGGPSREIEAQLLRLGKKEIPPKFNECIALFVQADLALYQKRMPFLNESDCIDLHQKIGQYLQIATATQRLARSLEYLDKALDNAKMGKDPKKYIHKLAVEMSNKRHYLPEKNPSMMVYEYYADFSLKKEQCDGFIKMITPDASGNFPPILLQMSMGRGKTSVGGSLNALEKADGHHLSILFTPKSQLKTNTQDLKTRNLSFFGQKGNTFTFNRGKKYFNAPYLQRLYERLIHTIIDRQFLILDPETLLSMQNQYIEAREQIYVLRQKLAFNISSAENKKILSEIEQWQAPAKELKKILHLIRTRTPATFDEIDTLYSPRKELNYPGIETTKLDRFSVEIVSKLYELASTDPELKKLGLDLHANTQSRLLPNQMDKVKGVLAEKWIQTIIFKPEWAVYLGLEVPCDENKIKELLPYFLDPQRTTPHWIAKLHESDPVAADRWILIRQEIQQWLPSCWKYSANEHFSRSNKHPEYTAAKPNISANTPNENAEIAHPWELVNKTLQLYVSQGVDLEQTIAIVKSMQKLALFQLKKMGPGSTLEMTAAAKHFKKAIESSGQILDVELELMKLTGADAARMKLVQKVLNAGTAEGIQLIIQYLNEHLFSQIQIHKDQIYNNPMNLSGAVLSEQGYSGTADNLYIFSHTFLQKKDERIVLDKGASGRMIDIFCKSNPTLHSAPTPLKTPEQLMTHLHSIKSIEERNRFHAFIDIGAYFKGNTNSASALSFLRYFTTLDQSPIKGILYYDDESGSLACIKDAKSKPILLTGTDSKTIFTLTGLKKHQLFTFYDQYHTIGSNIIQKRNAKAFYTIGDHTTLTDYFQGGMRMRGLFEEQENEGIIPEDLIPLIYHRIEQPTQKCPTIEQALLFTEINGLLKDKEDNIKLFSVKLNALVRKEIRDNLFISSNDEEEELLYAAGRSFFMKPTVVDLYLQHASVPENNDREKFVKDTMNLLLKQIQPIKPYIPSDKFDHFEGELLEMARSSIPFLPDKDIQTKSQTDNETVEKVSDIDRKVDNLSELDIQTQTNLHKQQDVEVANELRWDFSSIETVMQQLLDSLGHKANSLSTISSHRMLYSLSNLMKTEAEHTLFSDCFSSQFLISSNFIHTVLNQKNLFAKSQKNSYEALLFKTPNQQFHILLLSSEEAKKFNSFLKDKGSTSQLSLLNSNGENIAGISPDLSHPEIQDLLVQIFFFAGRLSVLEQEQWQAPVQRYLAQNRHLKRDLFESALLSKDLLEEYHHGTLKRLLNIPSGANQTSSFILTDLKAAFFALKSESWNVCKAKVEKNFAQLTPQSDQELSFIIDIARKSVKTTYSKNQSQWGIDLIQRILMRLKSFEGQAYLSLIEKMIDALNDPLPHEIKEKIIHLLLETSDLPTMLIKKAFDQISNFDAKVNMDTHEMLEQLKQVMKFSVSFKDHSEFSNYINQAAERFSKCLIPNKDELKGYITIHELTKLQNAFEAIISLLRELKTTGNSEQMGLLIKLSRIFLNKYFFHMAEIRRKSEQFFSYVPDENKMAIEFFIDLNGKYFGIHPELDRLLREDLITPTIQNSYHKDDSTGVYSETKPSYYWRPCVEALKATHVPEAIEAAENIRLKFEYDA